MLRAIRLILSRPRAVSAAVDLIDNVLGSIEDKEITPAERQEIMDRFWVFVHEIRS